MSKTLIESINALNKNISEAAVEKETVLEGLQEFVDVINEDTETTVESIADAAEKIAEVLPDKIGITPTGTIEITENGTDIDIAQYATADVNVAGDITVNESYDISEGTLNGATYTIESGVTAHIPDGVVTIGNKSFMDNTTITKVVMPDSVTTMEDGVFQYPGSGDNKLPFGNCVSLKEIVFSNNLNNIAVGAFYGCTSLTSITIPDSVTSIDNYAFYECTSLTSIVIPDSVTSIGNNTFASCTSLTSITIPNSVTSIGERAFNGCTSLTSITIPDSVTSIGNEAFSRCTSLTSITIPNSVTSIGIYAFYKCTSLTDIYYTGTQAEWKQISIGSGAIPQSVTIHYEYTPN